MLLIETSAVIAIIQNEPEARSFGTYLATATAAAIPASCYLEACTVLRRQADGRADLDRLLAMSAVTFIPMDEAIARLAADAFARYGRGTGHPAALNFGDCIAYATAIHLDVPLLFKGDDFRHTDVKAAL
ncbi:MAG: type II toxin-antitoxin system VapC family toxin [Proteobacteria bacterium]|nr:type II toxin-antitoxin system VapC family toxin [Pseudomonadota bacterium]